MILLYARLIANVCLPRMQERANRLRGAPAGRIGFGDLGDAFEYIKKKKKKKKKLGSTVTPVSRRKMTVGRA